MSDVPQEYRAEVDRIFFEYLNKICSNRKSSLREGLRHFIGFSTIIVESGCHGLEGRTYTPDIDGKEDATLRRVA